MYRLQVTLYSVYNETKLLSTDVVSTATEGTLRIIRLISIERQKKERNRSRYDSELINRSLRNFCEISCDIFGRVDSFCFLFSSVVCLPNSEGSRGQCYAD